MRELVELGILVTDAPPVYWQPADLAYHQASQPSGAAKRAATVVESQRPVWSGDRIELPRESEVVEPSLHRLLAERRSVRAFSAELVTIEKLGGLLNGVAGDRPPTRQGQTSRPYPSGGATYSLEVYTVIPPGVVSDLGAGLYHYDPKRHALERISSDEIAWRSWVASSGGMMGLPQWEGPYPVVILVTSRFGRVCASYADIAYRLVLMEVGALLQTMYLVGQSLGLGVCALGGASDEELLGRLTGIDKLEEPLMAQLVVGVPA